MPESKWNCDEKTPYTSLYELDRHSFWIAGSSELEWELKETYLTGIQEANRSQASNSSDKLLLFSSLFARLT
jgi:hypothetical protein